MTTDPMIKYWPQLIAIVMIAFGLGGAYIQLAAQGAEIEENAEKVEQQESTLDEVNEKVARIETKQEAIQEDVGEIKSDIKTILKELRQHEREE